MTQLNVRNNSKGKRRDSLIRNGLKIWRATAGLCEGWEVCDPVARLAVTFLYHGQITEVD
jgi:hypothetical protein